MFVGETVSGRTVHEELSNHLPTLLNPSNTDFLLVNKFLSHSGFFFQIMVKSMAQHLLSTGRIKVSFFLMTNTVCLYPKQKHINLIKELEKVNLKY